MKKTLLCIGLVTVLAGCTQFNVTPATSIIHEYGEDLDKSMLFDKESSTEGVKVKGVDGFDALKVGTQEVSVVFTDAEEKQEFENQHVCKATTLGNSGLLFSTEGEAAAYGEGLINQRTATSYTATSVFCECNTFVGYTVDYSNEVAQQPAETPKEEDDEHTCKADGQWTMVGNSGVAFYTEEEADEYVKNNTPENHGAAIMSTYDVCSNEGWTIQWFELDFD